MFNNDDIYMVTFSNPLAGKIKQLIDSNFYEKRKKTKDLDKHLENSNNDRLEDTYELS